LLKQISTDKSNRITQKSSISTHYANKITILQTKSQLFKAGRLFRHETARLEIYWNCKNIFHNLAVSYLKEFLPYFVVLGLGITA